MQGIEQTYCNICINAVIGAWCELKESSVAEALRPSRYGKGDTLGLDAGPEITIVGRLREFDQHAILITEELDDQAHRRWPTDSDPIRQPLMFFCDPTDRSVQLKLFLETISRDNDPAAKVGTLMNDCKPSAKQKWEELIEGPAEITGSTSAITCVRKGKVIFSVILNYITDAIYVAAEAGVFQHSLQKFGDPSNEGLTLDDIIIEGKKVVFQSTRELSHSPDECKRFVTFLGKTGYRENFDDSQLFAGEPDKYLHHREPPGPLRTLYLSEYQIAHSPIGFILANGEKIGEWMHWLPFVKFARNKVGERALRVFEIALERPWTKSGMLMSTSPEYSIFTQEEDMLYLDISRLRNFRRPSQFRAMLVVTRYDNERMIHILQQQEYREVTDFF